MKRLLILFSLLVLALFVVSCAPKEAGEEGALAGEAVATSDSFINKGEYFSLSDKTGKLRIYQYIDADAAVKEDGKITIKDVSTGETINLNTYINLVNGVKIAQFMVHDYEIIKPNDPINGPYTPEKVGYNFEIYPKMFASSAEINEGLNLYLVVGYNAKPQSNLAANDIATGLVENGYDIQDVMKLDSEVKDLSENNLILVGNSCDNTLIGQLTGWVPPQAICEGGFSMGLGPGQGMLKLYQKEGKKQLLVTGYDEKGIRNAAIVLRFYPHYQLINQLVSGNELIIEGEGINYVLELRGSKSNTKTGMPLSVLTPDGIKLPIHGIGFKTIK